MADEYIFDALRCLDIATNMTKATAESLLKANNNSELDTALLLTQLDTEFSHVDLLVLSESLNNMAVKLEKHAIDEASKVHKWENIPLNHYGFDTLFFNSNKFEKLKSFFSVFFTQVPTGPVYIQARKEYYTCVVDEWVLHFSGIRKSKLVSLIASYITDEQLESIDLEHFKHLYIWGLQEFDDSKKRYSRWDAFDMPNKTEDLRDFVSMYLATLIILYIREPQ